MEDYAKLYHLLFNAITDALEQMNAQNFGSAKEASSPPSKKQKKSISQQKTKKAVPLSGERSNAAPSEATAGWIIQKGGARPLPFGR